jgi:hypothetical protein
MLSGYRVALGSEFHNEYPLMPIDLVHNATAWIRQIGVCDRLRGNAGLDESIEELPFPEASVEAIADFGKIRL